MGFCVIDGPERAGKSTLITELAKRVPKSEIRSWQGPALDQRNTRFLHALKTDYTSHAAGAFVIWDRSWLSHSVYGMLMQSEMNETVRFPALGDWFYGRAVDTLGAKFVLLPSDPAELKERKRDRKAPDDARVHYKFEYTAYVHLAKLLGWNILLNDYTPESLERNVQTILDLTAGRRSHRLEEYVCPQKARVVFVMERPKETPIAQNAEWLPFSQKEGLAFLNMLGTKSLECGWAYCHRLPPQTLRTAPILVTFGDLPAIWCRSYVGHQKVVSLPKLSHVLSAKYDQEWPRTLSLLRDLMATTETMDAKEA